MRMMDVNVFSDMNQAYYYLTRALTLEGDKVANTTEINNMMFTITNPKNSIAQIRTHSKYGVSLSYALGELVWYLSGDNSVDFIGKFGSLWKRISDDGVTNNSAYGYIIERKWGFNQLDLMQKILSDDPDSRRAVININTPHYDVVETNDEPCTVSLQFFLRDGELNMTTVMRSNDIWFGTPYDVIYFTTLQQILAARLGVKLGHYTHFAGSLHVYDRNLEDIEKVSQYEFEEYDDSISIDVLKLYDNVDDFKNELLAMGTDETIKDDIIELAKRHEII